MAANITKAYLLYVPFEKDYAHTLYFASAAAQQAYFLARKKFEATDLSYQRKDGVIRFPAQMDAILDKGCNYVMYQNAAYSNRWFYAFITDLRFENPQHTNITIATDCIQTWMFDITVKPSFVEREHAASDALGEHTLDEGLEVGEYVANRHKKAEYGGAIYEDSVIVVGVTKEPDGTNVKGGYYDGIYSGIKYYAFTNAQVANDALNNFLEGYDQDGIGEAVSCLFMAPKKLATPKDGGNITSSNLVSTQYINHSAGGDLNTTISMTTSKLDGYTPRNKKLMAFPFRYLLVANNSGASIPFKYERFYTTSSGTKTVISPSFIIEGCLTPGCSVRMVPLNYNGVSRNDEEGINMGKYPVLNWTSDVYTNWLTQNGVNIALQVVSGAGQIVAGAALAVATGGAGGAVGGGQIVGGVSSIAGTLSQIHQQSFAPPQAKGNLNAGDVVTASDQNDFHFYDMTVKAEYAKILDEYFDMYGYKCNRVKTPAKAHRKAFWFTKTIDAAIDGAIPQADLQIIKDAYNKGITFWRHTVTIKDYTQDNAIV